MVPRIVVLNGPNLNLIGKREPEIYGDVPLEDYMHYLWEKYTKVQIEHLQSNHEGQLIDWVQGFGFHVDGIIINAGGYAHTSVALRDAISSVPCPVVGVHISNIMEREDFRHRDLLSDVCIDSVVGQGLLGYELALLTILENIGFEIGEA